MANAPESLRHGNHSVDDLLGGFLHRYYDSGAAGGYEMETMDQLFDELSDPRRNEPRNRGIRDSIGISCVAGCALTVGGLSVDCPWTAVCCRWAVGGSVDCEGGSCSTSRGARSVPCWLEGHRAGCRTAASFWWPARC